MTFAPSPLVKAYIWASKQARDRKALEEWVETQKPRMREHLPAPEADQAIDEARQHWRKLGGGR